MEEVSEQLHSLSRSIMEIEERSSFGSTSSSLFNEHIITYHKNISNRGDGQLDRHPKRWRMTHFQGEKKLEYKTGKLRNVELKQSSGRKNPLKKPAQKATKSLLQK
jgi:hypothetical protein